MLAQYRHACWNEESVCRSGKSTLLIDDVANGDITTVLEIVHSTSSTASNGIGSSISFLLDNDNDAITEFGSVSVQSTDVTSGTEASKMIFNTCLLDTSEDADEG